MKPYLAMMPSTNIDFRLFVLRYFVDKSGSVNNMKATYEISYLKRNIQFTQNI